MGSLVVRRNGLLLHTNDGVCMTGSNKQQQGWQDS